MRGDLSGRCLEENRARSADDHTPRRAMTTERARDRERGGQRRVRSYEFCFGIAAKRLRPANFEAATQKGRGDFCVMNMELFEKVVCRQRMHQFYQCSASEPASELPASAILSRPPRAVRILPSPRTAPSALESCIPLAANYAAQPTRNTPRHVSPTANW